MGVLQRFERRLEGMVEGAFARAFRSELQPVEVARRLRLEEKFSGYIHLKTIPESSAELVEKAGLYADRLSINVELPTDEGVKKLAPEKKPETIRLSMARLRQKMEEKAEPTLRTKKRERFAPGGQSTQMIVGARRSSCSTA